MAKKDAPAEAGEAKAPVRSVERWAALKGTPHVWLRAACAGQGWTTPRLILVDEATYDAAVSAAQTTESR